MLKGHDGRWIQGRVDSGSSFHYNTPIRHFHLSPWLTNQVGGAVYATGSGTAQEQHPVTKLHLTYPVIFRRCSFASNRAAGTGGAIECAAGNYIVSDTHFEQNRARAGGALRLAGAAIIENCSFVENASDNEEGPAVSNIGVISEVSNCTFVDNMFQCEPETFLGFNPVSSTQYLA